MIFSVFYFFLIFFAAFGFWEFSKLFFDLAHVRLGCLQEEKTIILELKGHREDVEYIVRSAVAAGEKFPFCELKIICVNLGADGETEKICRLLSRDFPSVKLVGFR